MSSRYIKANLYESPAMISSIKFLNAPGAEVTPIGNFFHLNKPIGVMKAVKCCDSSSKSIWKKPDVKSMFEKKKFPSNESFTLLFLGNGRLVFSICLFRAL